MELTGPIGLGGLRTPLVGEMISGMRIHAAEMGRTLSCRIDHLRETHAIVDYQLLPIRIFYRGIVCLWIYGYFATKDRLARHIPLQEGVTDDSVECAHETCSFSSAYQQSN